MTKGTVEDYSSDCPSCDSPQLVEGSRNEKFEYGLGDERVSLTAIVPVITCSECGFEFTDHRAEEARHDAVCNHLGVLTPRDIVEIRESAGLTRAQFAALGGFGPASLQRWETGALIQNPANDRLIYLLQFTANRQRIAKKMEPPQIRITLDAAGESAFSPERRPSTVHAHTLSTSILVSDESLMRAAGIFSELMNEGSMFQHA